MRSSLAILLIILTLTQLKVAKADEAPHLVVTVDDGIKTAPQAPPWPIGLPPAVVVSGKTILEAAMADAVHERFAWWDTYPAQCQGAMDHYAKVIVTQCDGRMASLQASLKVEADKRVAEAGKPGLRWYHVAGLVVGSLIVGAAGGVLLSR